MFDYRATLIQTLVSQFHENIWMTYMLTIFFVTGVVATSFFTIFKMKFNDYIQLVPGHTDCVTFCSFTSLFSKLISVAGFNFMIMTGEVQLRTRKVDEADAEATYIETSFINFFSGMIETPFLGEQYNIFMPGLILVFAGIFIAVSACGYESKAV